MKMLKKLTKDTEWFIKGGPVRILIALNIVFVLAGLYLWNENRGLTRQVERLCIQLEDYEGCRTESPYGDPPLKVAFSDGRVAYVNFFSLSVPNNIDEFKKMPENAQLNMESGFRNALKSFVYAQLESVDLEYARKNRVRIALRIFENMKSMESVLEAKLIQFDFLEFCEPITRNNQN